MILDLGEGSDLMNIINDVANIVETACQSKSNTFGYGVWSHHIISVVEYGKVMAIELGADVEVVQLAALLHDYAGIIDKNLYEDHHIHSGREARRILSSLGYPKEKIDLVEACIYSHRGSRNIKPESVEALCLADADAIAHIDNVPSLMYLAYQGMDLNIEEGAVWVSEKIERSYNKLSIYGKELIRIKYKNTRTLLTPA